MSQVEPMTAAEYRQWCNVGLGVNTERTLAALEERERLLGERSEWMARRAKAVEEVAAIHSDASLGALVRRIREHPKNRDRPYPIRPFGCDSVFSIDAAGLTAFLRYLDSLLPKEPEVVVKLGGRTWTFGTSPVGNTNVWWRPGDGTSYVTASGELELALNALNALGGGK